MLHPCQHLVGAKCWETVPEERKDKCPVCKVGIECIESVRVFRSYEKVEVEVDKKMREEIDMGWKRDLIVKEKMKKGLKPDDVAGMLYFMNLRDSWDINKERIEFISASSASGGTQAVTDLHLDRFICFLAHLPQHKDDITERKIVKELQNFNTRRGTNFSLDDFRMAMSSPKDLDECLRRAETLKRNVKKFPRIRPLKMGQD